MGTTRGNPAFFGALAFVSGFCALGYEVLYVRHLTTLLGDMFYVHAALLSSFLVGVGAGALLAHRAHRWLAAMEVGTGVFALVIPFATRGLSSSSVLASITGSPPATILVTGLLIATPSLLIGFSIPLFSAYAKERLGDRPAFQRIYTVYNLGAFVGILAVEFALLQRFGISGSLAVLGLTNIVVGGLLFAAGSAALRKPPVAARAFPRRVLGALAIASAASAVFQMFFLKTVFLVFGPHRENFAVGLAVILLGISLGSAFASRVRIRFETALVLVPFTIGALVLVHEPLLSIFGVVAGWASVSDARHVATTLILASAYGFLPMFLFGTLIPALMRTEGAVAEESGRLLAVSSFANAAGYLVYVALAQPLLPSVGVLVGVGGLAIAAVGITYRAKWRLVELVLAIAGVVVLFGAGARWTDRDLYLARFRGEFEAETPFEVFKSGGESVSLVGGGSGSEWVSYNGHPSIWVTVDGAVNYAEAVSGVIPALSAPRLESALVLGLGTGITAGSVARLFDRVDVVEINAAFIDLLPRLAGANLDVADNPTATIHLADGRAFLNGKEAEYDAIVNSIPTPTYFSASKIYTVEFYERVRQALKPDGVFSTWLSVSDMSEEGLEVVLAALAEVFERCDLRVMRGDYYMATCSSAPLAPRAYSALGAPRGLDSILAAGLTGLDLDRYFEDVRLSENLFATGRPTVTRQNTDDDPVLEYMIVRNKRRGPDWRSVFHEDRERFGVDPTRGLDPSDRERFAHRAEVFRRLATAIYRTDFAPVLRRDTLAAHAHRELLERTDGE